MLWVIITTVCRNSALVRLISPSTSALVLLSRLPVGYIQLVQKKNHQRAAARWWFFYSGITCMS